MKLSRNKGQSASAAENSQVKGFAFVSYLWIFFTPECLCLCLLDFAQSLRALVCMARKVLVAGLKKKRISVPRISDLKQQLSTMKAELDRYKKMAGLTCGEVVWKTELGKAICNPPLHLSATHCDDSDSPPPAAPAPAAAASSFIERKRVVH